MRRTRGFVLVNALILVAALAAAAVFLLTKAEEARLRRAAGGDWEQLRLYLDGFEALGMTLLDRDQTAGGSDHLGEAWAQAEYDVAVDRGRVAGSFHDLQGRFNINWLSNPEDIAARAAFEALLARIGLPPARAGEIASFVTPGVRLNAAEFSRRTPPVNPVGGPILFVEQLRLLPRLSARDYARLSAYVTALPADSQLNVNTAAPEVLRSFLAVENAAALDRVIRGRILEPFVSVEDFLLRAAEVMGAQAVAGLDETRLSVRSSWFAADMAARLGTLELHRHAVFERRPLPAGARVAYRLDKRP